MKYLIDNPAVIFSSLALALSIFTFYWTSIRYKKSLHLIRIDKLGVMDPNFALVNGGSQDILFTMIECGFNDADNNGCSYPSQRIELIGAETYLLPAGKAYHCTISFLEPFTSTFVLAGEKSTKHTPIIYMRDMHINVEWVELSGKQHKSSVKISKYGFLEDGTLRLGSPLQKEHNLYKS